MKKGLFLSVVLGVVARARATLVCHSIVPSIPDSWCNANCNNNPPNCPPADCKCAKAPTPSPMPAPAPGPVPPPTPGFQKMFELDLFVNDPDAGWQPSGFPEYLQHNASMYTNVAGISFIQPTDLLNQSYDLPAQVGAAVQALRRQGVIVQLLVGGQVSKGWPALTADPQSAASNAVKLMQKYDCGIEVDDEAGGDPAGLVTFVELCYKGKPNGTHVSMDVAGTPHSYQKAVIKSGIDSLDWVNLMVSTPQYDQGNSVKYAHEAGAPFNKITVAYYAGTWVDNCNSIGSATNTGDTAAGLALVKQYGLKGLSIWAVGGASYANCGTTDAPGFSEAMKQLGI